MYSVITAQRAICMVVGTWGRSVAVAGMLALVLTPLLLTARPAAAAGAITQDKNYCVAVIAPRVAAETVSRVLRQDCFATAEAKSLAIMQWQGELGVSSLYLLIRFWEHAYRGGAVMEYFSASGCNGGAYGVPDMSVDGWDNVASSVEGYCGRNYWVFENPNYDFGGATRGVYGYIDYLGALNDQISSWSTQ